MRTSIQSEAGRTRLLLVAAALALCALVLAAPALAAHQEADISGDDCRAVSSGDTDSDGSGDFDSSGGSDGDDDDGTNVNFCDDGVIVQQQAGGDASYSIDQSEGGDGRRGERTGGNRDRGRRGGGTEGFSDSGDDCGNRSREGQGKGKGGDRNRKRNGENGGGDGRVGRDGDGDGKRGERRTQFVKGARDNCNNSSTSDNSPDGGVETGAGGTLPAQLARGEEDPRGAFEVAAAIGGVLALGLIFAGLFGLRRTRLS
jgi:hypothetical protein